MPLKVVWQDSPIHCRGGQGQRAHRYKILYTVYSSLFRGEGIEIRPLRDQCTYETRGLRKAAMNKSKKHTKK
jgi:hypothetical protein